MYRLGTKKKWFSQWKIDEDLVGKKYPRKDIKGNRYVLSRVYFEMEYGRTDHVKEDKRQISGLKEN